MFKYSTKISLIIALSVILITMNGVFAKAVNDREDNDNSSLSDLLHGRGIFGFTDFPIELERETIFRNPSFNINPNGRVIITSAVVTQSNWPNLQVKVWGITLNVTVSPNARIHGVAITTPANTSGATSTPSTTNVTVGDKVDIVGTIDNNTGIISADNFKDRTQTSSLIKSLQDKIQDLLKQIQQLRLQLQNAR